MGRITVFALDGCPHCKRVKAAFSERNIPYMEINLSAHPDKLTDMLSLVKDNPTVPQVFFNDLYIGGVDETLAQLEKWDKEVEDGEAATASARYEQDVGSRPDPLERRLASPHTPTATESQPPPRNEVQDCIRTPGPGGSKMSVLNVTRRLMDFMPRADLSFRGRVYKNSFTGADGVTAIMKMYDLEGRAEAVFFGRLLQRRHILHHVKRDHEFGDNGFYYRLQPFENPTVLNSFRLWTDRVDPDPMALIIRLKKLMTMIETRHMDAAGKVDYLAIAADPDYFTFEEAVCELQQIDFPSDEKTKLAFAINVYNLMVKHGFIKVGIPSSALQRQSFFNGVCYDIGGDILSFSEVEHGILRANSKPPYGLSPPFSQSDPRLRLAVATVDARIHFALNCGAKSCPPVKNFTAERIDEELRIASLAFCGDDANVRMDQGRGEVCLSTILNWYQPDFASSTTKLPEKVVTYLQGERKLRLQKMINSGKGIKVKFIPYDWSTDAATSKEFDSRTLKEDESIIRSINPFRSKSLE